MQKNQDLESKLERQKSQMKMQLEEAQHHTDLTVSGRNMDQVVESDRNRQQQLENLERLMYEEEQKV